VINDDENDSMLPFKHSKDDQQKLRSFELDYNKDISMVSSFGDIDQLGIDFDLQKDFAQQTKETQE
jgi:hypothetical protein